MNYPKLWQPVIGLTLAILFLVGCASPPPTSMPTPPPTATPTPTPPSPPPPSANLVNNWRLYVTDVRSGQEARPLAQLSPPPPEAKTGWRWVALTLRLENITGSWITFPDGRGISGGVLDSGGNERELAGINFAPYTRLAAGQGIYPGPQFQIEGLAWVELLQDQTPTDVWLRLDNDGNGQVDETLGVNLAESPQPPPLFDSLHMTVNGPGYVFDYGGDVRATVTALRLEPMLDGQVRLRVELALENLSGSVMPLDAEQFAQVWGIDQAGHYFCCWADEAGQGGDFGPERKLPPGQTAAGFITATPFYPGSETAPEALVALTIRSKSNAVTNLFFAKLGDTVATPGAAIPTATELPEPTLRAEPTNDVQSQTPSGQGETAPGQTPLALPFGERTTLAGLPCAAPTLPYPTVTPVLNPDATIEPDEGSFEESPAPTPSAQEPGQVPATVEPTPPNDSVDAVFIQDQYAYLNLGSNLVILDISDPVRPVAAGSAALPANTPAASIYVLDHYAYVLADGLRIFDVSNPTQPAEVGCFSLPIRDWTEYIPMVSPLPPPHRGMDVVARRAETGRLYAYIAAHAAGLRIVDVSDPAAPVEVGSYEFEPTPAVTGIVVSGNLAYLASPDGLRIVDVSRPTQPV
ncbi:MAG: hypothetical protein DPW09_02140 [Anaerolineae bacterium]|nr:hypothetical protein [Anaerolineae bacterium]MCQ3972229.1 hypothetical protein [Anaerolineae bacterium]